MNNGRILRVAALVLVLGNLFLALIKTGSWIYTDSLALQSESVNSWIDTVYSLVVLIGVVVSTREPNERFPEGHHRVEPFISIVIGVGVIVTAAAVGSNALSGILSPQRNVEEIEIGLGVLVLSAVMKYAMYKYCNTKHSQAESPLLRAVAIDNRNDVLTILVAFIGIVGYNLGIFILDAIAALLVSIAIAYSGLNILRDNVGYVLGESVDKDEKEKLTNEALAPENINGVHDVKIHYSGPRVDVSMHLEVDGGITVEEAHKIETTVGSRIREASSNPINEINLHVDPKSLDEWEN